MLGRRDWRVGRHRRHTKSRARRRTLGRRAEGGGATLRLAALDGPVVVNFWASWCGPCAKEQPEITAVARAYKGEVSFVGVNVKDSRANAQAFTEQFAVPYPSWFDDSAAIAARFGGIGAAALPTTLVLDEQHAVAARLVGGLDRETLTAAMEATIAPTHRR